MEPERLIGIVQKAQHSDSEALQELYLDMYRSVYYLALRFVKNPEDAEDITQEVYITVQQKIPELREPVAFYGWVNQITVNKCNRYLSKYKGISRLDDEDEIINLVDDDPTNLPDKALDDEATRKIILEVIDNLPDGQRACILLYYYTQNTIAQISDMLEINENTVKSRLALGRAKIRAALEHKAEKEGIKLWGIPLALTPIFREAMENFVMPQGAEARILDFISRATAEPPNVNANNSPCAEQPGSSGGAGNAVNTAINSAATAAKTGGILASKGVIAAIITISAAAVITAGVILLPPLLSPSDNPTPPGVTATETPPPASNTPSETPSGNDPTSNPGSTNSPSTPSVSSPSSDPGNSQAETPSSGNTDIGMAWPDTWPGEVPKIDGRIYLVSDDSIDTPTGVTVFLYVENADAVKAYIEKLESAGIKKTGGTGDFDIGVVAWTFESDDYVMHINYKESDQKCLIDISTSDEYRI